MRSALFLVGMLLLFGLSACADPCGNELLREVPSADGRFKAVVFQRDCGATTRFSTQVSVLPATELFLTTATLLRSTQSGNAFVADTNFGEAPIGPGGGPVVQVEWVDATRLRITHDRRARIILAATSVGGVNIERETK